MKMNRFFLTLGMISALSSCTQQAQAQKQPDTQGRTPITLSNEGDYMELLKTLSDGVYAAINTTKGDIIITLHYQQTPLTVSNFVGLSEGTIKNNSKEEGVPFYDGLRFHRVIPDFMVQGGDPMGTGTGGPGYKFDDEIVSGLVHNKPGILSMANAGPGTNGSQFFITHVATPWLDGKHTVFGEVVQGQDVVNAIATGDTILKVSILRKGSSAEAFRPNSQTFEELQKSAKEKLAAQAGAQEEALKKQIQAKFPQAKKTGTGIYYVILKEGSGAKPRAGQQILAHYEGRFLDGKVFDSSYSRNEPFEVAAGAGQVIPGWDETLLDMKAGEKRTIVLPPDMAYGARGAGGVIPPNAWLEFDVEILQLK